MKTKIIFLIIISIILSCSTSKENRKIVHQEIDKSQLGEELNYVYMVVGKKAVTKLELDRITKLSGFISKIENRKIEPEDFLIEKLIVEQVAEEESIIVNEERIKNEIEKRRLGANIKSMDEFQKVIEKETGLPFELWKEVLRYQLLKQQIIQIRIPIPQPTEKEIEDFYQKHKREIGIEVLFREIVFPKTYTIQEEKKIYEVVKDVYNQLQQNPNQFSEIAKNLKENVSPYKYGGGIRLWTLITDIAKEDQIIAGAVFRLSVGSISPVFKNQNGQYVIVKVEGKRPIPLDKVQELIRIRLYYDKAEESFQNWLEQKKRDLIIKKLS
ncbi:MAG: putative peptidyl-prolyl cis-trans isomerase [Leptospiraceae bacterium]|nr:MAG: putative peptidyl-prolyl cis-trans isomerase [Leptospiraceae bacterium]